jgi:hypothetical protein
MIERRVIFNGVPMIEGWPERINEAQGQTHYEVGGQLRERIRCGNEVDDWGADRRPCHDCGVTKGRFHVWGCDVERCPSSGGQAIFCECDDPADA